MAVSSPLCFLCSSAPHLAQLSRCRHLNHSKLRGEREGTGLDISGSKLGLEA